LAIETEVDSTARRLHQRIPANGSRPPDAGGPTITKKRSILPGETLGVRHAVTTPQSGVTILLALLCLGPPFPPDRAPLRRSSAALDFT
jgi:hypothetical protein